MIRNHIFRIGSVEIIVNDLTVLGVLALVLGERKYKALPFEPLIPNATTIEAMKEARKGKLPRFATVNDLMADLHAAD